MEVRGLCQKEPEMRRTTVKENGNGGDIEMKKELFEQNIATQKDPAIRDSLIACGTKS
jgi:hypothetical protein